MQPANKEYRVTQHFKDERTNPISVSFEFQQVIRHQFTKEAPRKVIPLTLKIQNLLQNDECQYDVEVVAN